MRRLKPYSAVLVALCLMPMVASAQEHTKALHQQSLADTPRGFPYNTAEADSVTLRDFISSRQDQQRAELIERIEVLERQFRQIIDERDKQYAQRFAAQQEALQAALSAAKEAVANALTAADRAVAKAEAASEKRFEAVNEFRSTLADQATNFMSKDTAEARFEALEEKANNNSSRLDNIQSVGEGRSDSVGWAVGILGVLTGLGMLLFNITKNRDHRPAANHREEQP